MTTSAITITSYATLALLALLAPAQPASPTPPIIAKHYETAPAAREIESPMLLEVSLGATAKRPSVQAMDSKHAWIATETAAYSCKAVQVRFLQVWKEEKHGKVHLRVVPVMNEEPDGVDVAVSVSIESDSKEIRSREATGRHITASAIVASPLLAALDSSSSPESDFEFTREEFAALFGPGRAPSVRVVVKVVNDD